MHEHSVLWWRRRGGREASMRNATVFRVTNFRYHATRRLIGFSSAVDVTIQHFNESTTIECQRPILTKDFGV
jgi:hypothetical protein